MTSRLVLVERAVDLRTFDAIDARATVMVLSGEAAGGLTEDHFDRLVRRRSMVIVAVRGASEKQIAAAGLLADWFVLSAGGRLNLSQPWPPELSAGLAQRRGRGMMAIALLGPDMLEAGEALREGLVDGLVPGGDDPLQWMRGWLGKRSLTVLQSAARLTRLRGGDPLERAEFARLFAAGEPQQGLRRFLAKEPARFSEDVETEIV
jgi:enoyl-CoA hydratase/carnithine racemase